MKKFLFRLQSVLKLRQSREDEALRALGAAQRAYQAELAVKARLLADLDESYRRVSSFGDRPIGALNYQLEENFISGQKARVVRQDQAILRAARGVERALRVYLHARRQTRTIEVLREKDYAGWRKMVSKREQRETDELVTMRAARQQREDVA